jgi:Concanavalin A-like lectin/glucanases superfamily
MTYLGQPGSVGQGLTVGTGGRLGWSAPTSHPLDANHIYAWSCNSVSGDGTTIAADVGGTNLVGSNLVAEVSMFKYTPSVSTTANAFKRLEATLPVTIGTTTSVTLEAMVQVARQGLSTWGNYANMISIGGNGDSQYFLYRGLSETYILLANFRSGNPYGNIGLSYGTGGDQFSTERPHHVMVVWDMSASAVYHYLDGFLVGTTGGQGTRSNDYTYAVVGITQNGGSVANVRVSNVARSQDYARAATRAMYRL